MAKQLKGIKDIPEVSGTLDIGAGDRPIREATVAVDINIPTKPTKKPFDRSIRVIVDETAEDAIGLPLKLSKTSKIRLYWAGDARDLPDEWEGKFNKVYSDSSVGIFLTGAAMGKEIAGMLKPGGKVEIIANGTSDEAFNRRHIEKVQKMLKAGGLNNIKVEGELKQGNFTFTAERSKNEAPESKKKTVKVTTKAKAPVVSSATDPRSKIAIATDNALLAKTVTTDREEWAANRSNIDLKGVDTPSGRRQRITPKRPRIK